MKQILLTISLLVLIGCSNPKTFVLKDNGESKYFVSKTINKAFEENQIDKSPLIVINGRPFKYNKNEDTIILPLKKTEIKSVAILNINSSRIIYNDKENAGAVIIMTKNQEP